MVTSILDMQHITFQTSAKTKDEALQFIADFAKEQGIVKSAKAYYKGLKKREEEVTTGFKNSIAIPHCKHRPENENVPRGRSQHRTDRKSVV